jgi:SAM-dependent methyltransferase
MDPWGEGPGDITRDGCAVDVYARLPPAGEAELVHDRIPSGATILDLGCGTGRLAEPLSELGHVVTGVDDSPAMLAHLEHAEPVLSTIEELRLDRRYQVVLLVSNLMNHPRHSTRQRFLSVAASHLMAGGQVLIQWEPPGWFDWFAVGTTHRGVIGEVGTEFTVHADEGDLLTATVTYVIHGNSWSHHFTTRRLTIEDLEGALLQAGLQLHDRFGPGDTWVEAREASSP